MKYLFKPGRSAAQTRAQIRKQFHKKRKLKLAFEPDWHLTHGFLRPGITAVDLRPTQVSNSVYEQLFPNPCPVRSTVQVVLPFDALVAIESTAHLKQKIVAPKLQVPSITRSARKG